MARSRRRKTQVYGRTDGNDRLIRLGIFILWLALVAVQIAHHAVWRDEVRALSFALQGDDVVAMWRGLRGDAHPALWHLMLRGGYALTGRMEVLQGLALLVASAAMALLLWRAPFHWAVLALFAFGHAAFFEYAVIARNYGISMLLLFVVAALWRWRGRGITIGLPLALLANTNVHSAFLACLIVGVWLLDRGRDAGSGRVKVINAVLVALAVIAAFLTVYPTFNDAVTDAQPPRTLIDLAWAVANPAPWFAEIMLRPPTKLLAPLGIVPGPWLGWAMSALMFVSLLTLVRRPLLLLAGAMALVGLTLLFCGVYIGFYRHEALWMLFMLTLAWIGWDARARRGVVEKVGWGAFAVILALQVPSGIKGVVEAVTGATPFSRSRDVARFIKARPALDRAIIMGDPDHVLEPLPYYLDNPIYQMRQGRFGKIVPFTRNARRDLGLDDFVAQAHALQKSEGRSVLILLRHRLDPDVRGGVINEGYGWTIDLRRDQVRRFLGATRRIASFPKAKGDEYYDVYWVKERG
ncbi:hypothetical protein [Sphingomonas montanisoli]|uniref:Glycosyltransferase RgtA/B/C/D-like domain-containing protein n=1 Tax=Sphingomonas montanisoli TaxID=2606412 RepID=A0A5D9CDW7_9SPHN|nr:hypothetical protein [Sphingomonas montanisoli]TZG29170.1 hypothetical protein FYJ91_03275 [Sphingomonas montanisoli]